MGVSGQILALTVAGIRSMRERPRTPLVSVLGTLTAVAVLTALLSMGEGVILWAARDARADRAIVLSRGAAMAPMSQISRDTLATISQSPGVKTGANGQPLISASSMAFVDVVRRNNTRGNIFVVGMNAQATAVYPEIRIVEGRFYRPGLRELIVSESVRKQTEGFGLGDTPELQGTRWPIVGVFADTGGVFDSVVFTDGDTLLSAFGMHAFQQVAVVLDSSARFAELRQWLVANPAIAVDVYTDAESREAPMRGTRNMLDFVSYFVGTLMAIGAGFTALSCQYSIVDRRRREIATLRALGFGSTPIITSILLQSLLLAAGAALLGILIATLLFNGNVISTSGFTFPLSVTPHIALQSAGWALAIGFVGALLPALRGSAQPMAQALRAS